MATTITGDGELSAKETPFKRTHTRKDAGGGGTMGRAEASRKALEAGREAIKIKRENGTLVMKRYADITSKLACKLAFFEGCNDQEELIKIGRCCTDTFVKNWLPEFEIEKRKLFLSFGNASLKLSVTDVELSKHSNYCEHLRVQSNNIYKEVENSDTLAEMLQRVIKELGDHPDLQKVEFGQVCDMLKSFAIAKKSRNDSLTMYMKLMTEWSYATGVKAHHDAAGGRIKEAERLRGKDDAGRNAEAGTKDGDIRKDSDFFDLD
jgi:hypothetical protein